MIKNYTVSRETRREDEREMNEAAGGARARLRRTRQFRRITQQRLPCRTNFPFVWVTSLRKAALKQPVRSSRTDGKKRRPAEAKQLDEDAHNETGSALRGPMVPKTVKQWLEKKKTRKDP